MVAPVFSSGAQVGIQLFFRAHRVARLTFLTERVTRSGGQFGAFIAGHLLDLTLGNYRAVRLTARVIAASRALVGASKACCEYHKALTVFHKALRPEKIWLPSSHIPPSRFGPQTARFLNRIIDTTREVMAALWQVVVALARLSSHLVALVNVFRNDEEVIHEQVQEIFTNCADLYQEIADYKKWAAESLYLIGIADRTAIFMRIMQLITRKADHDKIVGRLHPVARATPIPRTAGSTRQMEEATRKLQAWYARRATLTGPLYGQPPLLAGNPSQFSRFLSSPGTRGPALLADHPAR